MYRFVFLLFVGFWATMPLIAQEKHPYTLHPVRELSLLAGGGLMGVTGWYLMRRTPGMSEAAVLALDPAVVNRMDRGVIGNAGRGDVSDILRIMSFALPATFLLHKNMRDDLPVLGVMAAEVLAVTAGMTGLAKPLLRRTRPYAYDPSVSIDQKRERDARFSFYSGHVSLVAALSFFTAGVWNEYSEKKYLPCITLPAAVVITTVTAWDRVRAGEHFYSDVIVAALIGGATGYLLPKLHLNKERDTGWSFTAGVGGVVALWRF